MWKVGFATVPGKGRSRRRLALLSTWRAGMVRPRRMLPRTRPQAGKTAGWVMALGRGALLATMTTGADPACRTEPRARVGTAAVQGPTALAGRMAVLELTALLGRMAVLELAAPQGRMALLGLVGLHRRRLRHPRRPTGGRGARDGACAGGLLSEAAHCGSAALPGGTP